MSVYIRKDNKKGIYSYYFEFQGQRFSGSTRQTSRREAERVEREILEKVAVEYEANKDVFGKTLTFAQAAERWYEEVGKHRTDAERCIANIDWLLEFFGGSIALHDITESRVAAMVAKRRGQNDQRLKDGTKRLVGAATVNRTAIEPLRAIIVRARDIWQVQTTPIKFKNHWQKEPKERVREATVEEQAAILAHCSRGWEDVVLFDFLTGCRAMEIVGLKWVDVDWFNRQFTVLGKGRRMRTIPMSKAIYDLLWAQQGKHPEYVFTYVSAYTRKTTRHGQSYVKGERYPLSLEGFATAFETACAKAGVTNFRRHDMRHTAASRAARGGSLKAVQLLLGHSKIDMTMRYVHANLEDVRDALDNMTATRSPTKSPTESIVRVVK